MTSPPTGATIFCGDNKMHPRLPRSGKQWGSVLVISSPNKTAGGPVWHDPLQGLLGTQVPSPLQSPPAMGPAGAAGAAEGGHAGGVAGSGNAGVGNTNFGFLMQDPKPRKQLKQRQLSPPEPGKASVVVVGSGANRQDPVGSTAGKRRRLHPLATAKINNADTNRTRPKGEFRRRGCSLRDWVWFIGLRDVWIHSGHTLSSEP